MTALKFDPENPKYKCCYGKLHVKTATKWIIYFNFLLSLFFLGYLEFYDDVAFSWKSFFIALLIDVLLFASGLYAIKSERPKWLLPYLVVFIVITIVDAYVIASDLINKSYEEKWILYDIFDFVLNIWSIPIFYRCYQYLTAKKQSDVLPMSYENNYRVSVPFILLEDD